MSAAPQRWARPAPGEPYCLVDRIAGNVTDSVLTACLGRYVASTCTYVNNPPESERCKGCSAAIASTDTVVVDVDVFDEGTR